MADKILGTFRIEREKWEAFKTLASENGHTGSSVLVDFINKCLATNQVLLPDIDVIPTALDGLDSKIDERIRSVLDITYIQELVKQEVEKQLGELAA